MPNPNQIPMFSNAMFEWHSTVITKKSAAEMYGDTLRKILLWVSLDQQGCALLQVASSVQNHPKNKKVVHNSGLEEGINNITTCCIFCFPIEKSLVCDVDVAETGSISRISNGFSHGFLHVCASGLVSVPPKSQLGMGLGWVGWDVNILWHLLHEVDATLGMGLGGGGMLTFFGTCFMKLMLRCGWTRSLAYLIMCVCVF